MTMVFGQLGRVFKKLERGFSQIRSESDLPLGGLGHDAIAWASIDCVSQESQSEADHFVALADIVHIAVLAVKPVGGAFWFMLMKFRVNAGHSKRQNLESQIMANRLL